MRKVALERWHSPLGEPIPEEMIADMRSQPRFKEALHQNARELLTRHYNDPALHRSFVDGGRQVLAVLALYLGATGGVTHRRLRDLAGEGTVLSTGRATALLMQMRWMGYLEPVVETKRGAAKRYLQTPQLVADFLFRLRIDLAALELVAPEIALMTAQLDDPQFVQAFIADFGASVLSASRMTHVPTAPISAFYLRSAGMATLFAIYEHAAGEDYRSRHGSAGVSSTELAKLFGVSRTQIVRLLRDAERAGFIRQNAKQALLEVEPAFVDPFEAFWAIYFIGLVSSTCRTFQAMEAGALERTG